MKRREQLYDRREDIFFTQLMEEHMAKKGEQYLMWNELLKQDPGAAVPAEAYERGQKTIDAAYRSQRRRRAGRVTRKVIGLVAAVVACLMLVGVTAFAVSPAVRERVFALFVDVDRGESDGVTELSMGETLDADIDEMVVFGYSDPAIPEGFELTAEERGEDNICYNRKYTHEDGSIIGIYITSGAGNMTYGVYTEDADVIEDFALNDFEGVYVELGELETVRYCLADTVHGAYVMVSGYRVGADVLLSIVEQLHYIGS